MSSADRARNAAAGHLDFFFLLAGFRALALAGGELAFAVDAPRHDRAIAQQRKAGQERLRQQRTAPLSRAAGAPSSPSQDRQQRLTEREARRKRLENVTF